MKSILGVYGCGGLGREVLELARIINEREKRWVEIVFVVDNPTINEKDGAKVYDYNDAVKIFGNELEITIGIGEPASRWKVIEKVLSNSIPFATLVHPDVHIPESTKIGNGVTIQYGCYISCGVEVSDFVFIQPQANIGHDTKLKKGCIVSGLCNLAGNVTVGENSYIGLGANVMENMTIGEWSIISMAAAVYRPIPDSVIAVGNPARPMKNNEERTVFKCK